MKPKLGMLEEQRQHASLNTSMIQQCEYMYKSPCIEIYRHYSYEHFFYTSKYFKLISMMDVPINIT